jgi:NAD(P)H-hydrate epimerase
MRLPTRLLHRSPNSHKGDFGHVFILGGCARFSGAACLCAEAALRAGSGLVTLGIPRSLNNPVIKIKPEEVMTLPLAETPEHTIDTKAFKDICAFSHDCQAVVIGPGLGRNASTQNLIRHLILSLTVQTIIDADGLFALAGHMSILKRMHKGNPILTPHEGEMARLTGMSVGEVHKKRKMVAKKIASDYNSTVVLKGYRTIIADCLGKSYANTTGNPGMATAGSGDVLAGIIAAFVGQGLAPFDAAKYGVWLHGAAGDLAAEEKTQMGMIASDIIAKLAEAINRSS